MKLSVILVSYNQFPLLAAALESLRASNGVGECEVIVVDNASAEDVVAFLQPRFPEVIVIRNTANLGFGRANNIGAARARGEYLLFLNSDAVVFPDTLAAMITRMDADPAIGILGPLTLNTDHSFQLSYGRPIALWSEFSQKVWSLRREARRLGTPPRRDIERTVGWVSGSCLMTRREYFPDGMVFDPAMFLYFEDHELCLRVAAMGKRVVFWSGAAVIHHGGGSGGGTRGRAALEYRRSQLYLYARWSGRWQLRLLRFYLRGKFRRRRREMERNGDAAEARVCEEILALLA